MKTKEFSFDLPEELIAQTPADKRGTSRLLVLDRSTGAVTDMWMTDFASLLDPGSVLVLNNSRVRKARVYGTGDTGGIVEFLFLEDLGEGTWSAMVTKSKRQRIGKRFMFGQDGGRSWTATITGEGDGGTKLVTFDQEVSETFFSTCGHVPLPPYIKRDDTFQDESRYQTVYASKEGSVAAPTAGLHFTQSILEEIEKRGIEIVHVTLHVGAGTFLPVRSEDLEDHVMHWERYDVPEETAAAVMRAKHEKRPVVAVGTTSVRTLEAAWDFDCKRIRSGEGRTNLFIKGPYHFHVVDRLLTNFHTPQSTLLVLVSSFAGRSAVLDTYKYAVEHRYRFFSYGDAMYIR